MKKLLLLTTLITFVLGVTAQTTLFEDDFESYTVGDGIATQTDDWETWSGGSGGAEDAVISDDYANSGSNSMLVTGDNDMINDLGQKTSGVYDINFWYYMEDGYGGYYNIQHTFGSEWAFAVYLNDDGTGYLKVGNVEYDLTYPQDEWFKIENHIDLDADEATLVVNGEEIHTWQYSLLESSEDPIDNPMLDVLNFYSAGEGDAEPKYYVDDFEYIEVESGADPPQVGVSPTSITTNGQDAEFFTIENTGEQTLEFETYPVYPMDGNKKAASSGDQDETTQRVQLNHKGHNKTEVSQAETENGFEFNPENRDGSLTHVQSDLASGVGYDSETEVSVAAKYRPEDVTDYIGMQIDKVIIYHMDPPMNNAATMKLWGRGEFTTPGPGEMLYEADYTANEDTQEEISVDDEMYITGNELWAGYVTTDPGEGTYPLGSDDGPKVDGVNWSSTGPGWSELTLDSNWGIIVELLGDGIPTWMSVSPESGSIEPGNSEEIMIDFTTEGLESGIYNGEVHVGSNDPDNQYTVVSVELNVSGTGIGDQEKVGVMTYPNPTTNHFNVEANERINNIKVLNSIGQVVHSTKVGDDSIQINTSNLEQGVYMVRVETESNEVMTNKIVVK